MIKISEERFECFKHVAKRFADRVVQPYNMLLAHEFAAGLNAKPVDSVWVYNTLMFLLNSMLADRRLRLPSADHPNCHSASSVASRGGLYVELSGDDSDPFIDIGLNYSEIVTTPAEEVQAQAVLGHMDDVRDLCAKGFTPEEAGSIVWKKLELEGKQR